MDPSYSSVKFGTSFCAEHLGLLLSLLSASWNLALDFG